MPALGAGQPRLALAYPTRIERDAGDRCTEIRQLVGLVKHEHDLDLERFLAELVAATGVSWDRQLDSGPGTAPERTGTGLGLAGHTVRWQLVVWLAFCACTGVAPGLFRRSLARGLDQVAWTATSDAGGGGAAS